MGNAEYQAQLLRQANGMGCRVLQVDHTLDGNGAQVDSLATLTGAIVIERILMRLKTVTDATTCSGFSWATKNGTTYVEITDANTPLDLSAAVVGGIVMKNGAAATVAAVLYPGDAAAGAETANIPIVLFANAAVATTLVCKFTGDADTDIDVETTIWYRELIPGTSALTAV